MVVIPFSADQPVNARSVERAGVGRMLEYSSITKEHLKETVCSVMTDIEIKNNLHRIGEQIRRTPGNSAGAEKIIRYYEGKV
jgi:UDP:flavonoid glycosyltransferase YjiC (YdhE family)